MLAASASAENAADTTKGRYTMIPVEGGLMRLDTESGAVALCTRKGEGWVCDPVDDRSASSDKAKLEAENKALKDRIRSLENDAANSRSAQGGGNNSDAPGGVAKLPTEEEVDKAMDYVERIFKKFRDRLQKIEPPAPATPAPKSGEDGKSAL